MKLLNPKGISEIFSSLLVLLVVISLITPVMMYFDYANSSAKKAGLNVYNSTEVLVNLDLELVRVGNSFGDVYLYNYGSSPAYVQTVIYNGVAYSVDKVLPPGSLASLNALTGADTVTDSGSPVYVIANGTLLVL